MTSGHRQTPHEGGGHLPTSAPAPALLSEVTLPARGELAVAVLNLVSASRFGTQVSGGDTVTRALRLNNSSPCGEISGKNWGSYHKLCHVAAMLGGRWGWGKPMACDQDLGEALRSGRVGFPGPLASFRMGLALVQPWVSQCPWATGALLVSSLCIGTDTCLFSSIQPAVPGWHPSAVRGTGGAWEWDSTSSPGGTILMVGTDWLGC